MNTFGGTSGFPGPGSIPRRLLFRVGRSIPRRLLSAGGSLEAMGGEAGVPVPPTSQAVPPSENMNVLILMAALICALICMLSFVCMLRCALRCGRGAFRPPQAGATRRCDAGMKKAAVHALPTVIYCQALRPPEGGTDCPICLADFQDGDKLRALPHCNHCFHMECVDRWFRSHSSCPTCRNCLLGLAKAKAAAPSNNSQSGEVCESRGAQIPPTAESLARVAGQVGPPACQGDTDSESFGDDRSGMACRSSGKAGRDTACGIGR